MSRWLNLIWLLLPLSATLAGTPCDGVSRDLGLTPEQIITLKANIGLQVDSDHVDIEDVYQEQGWSIIFIDSHNADKSYLVFSDDVLTSRYITRWSGAATIFERAKLTAQFKKEAPGIPEHSAHCIAWHIAEQGKLPGVYSSMKFHSSDTGDVLGDEIMIGFTDDGNYWAVFQHAEGGLMQPVIVPVKRDRSNGISPFVYLATWRHGVNFTAW
ncbi:hypothetical protein [Superficieibacter electus]|uniref:hypothetical protein n=1 Tax=Superficieibacter electus TaxID=2022662 RepID=UPI0010570050|nr:hypothetical protein [Superficieibacter electus]